MIKSNYEKIIGAYCGIKLQKYPVYTEVAQCFLFYYDQDQIRICKSRDKPNYIFSNEKYLIGFGKINSLHIEVDRNKNYLAMISPDTE